MNARRMTFRTVALHQGMNQVEIPLQGLSSGLYILRIGKGMNQVTRKFRIN
jgi:hypothetical protein